MAPFVKVPIQGDPEDGWVNLESITHIVPNGDATIDIFMFDGLRITVDEAGAKELLQAVSYKFLRVDVVTRWTDDLETREGWVNVEAIASIRPGPLAIDMHLFAGASVSTAMEPAALMWRINAHLNPRRDDSLDCAECEAHNGKMHEYWCKHAGEQVNNI